MIAVNVTHGIKPIEVEGKMYALKKGDSAFIPSKLAGAMIKRGWAAKIFGSAIISAVCNRSSPVPLKTTVVSSRSTSATNAICPLKDRAPSANGS